MLARLLRSEGVWLFARSPAAILAAIVTLAVVMGALLAPWIAPTRSRSIDPAASWCS